MAEAGGDVVVFPFMAQGHIIPFLALAHHMEKITNYNIIFVNTPLNIQNLKSSLPPSSSIRLVEIPFESSQHGLPPHSENTDTLPYPLIIRLLHASTSLELPFRKFIQDQEKPPLCIISDIFFGWTASVAKELGVFHAIFSGAGAFGLACYYSVWSALPHRNLDDDLDYFELQDFKEASRIHVTQLPLSILQADGKDSWSVFQRKNLAGWLDSNGILFNTVEEIDQIGLMYFRQKLHLPAWPIGPVLLSAENRAGSSAVSKHFYKDWLDTKPESSVLYVCFGSNNTISPSQMMQLAIALEASGNNFIWVVRPPTGFNINSEFKTKVWLPQGFEDRIKDSKKGLMVQKWAPQVEILGHKSVCAFLSHCGWNSTLEALTNGVPLLGWAMAAEQFFNVKFLEEKLGVCLEVARGKTCEVRHEDIKSKIEEAMNDTKKGMQMRRKACEVKELIKSALKDEESCQGSSLKGLHEFLTTALLIGNKKEHQDLSKQDRERVHIK